MGFGLCVFMNLSTEEKLAQLDRVIGSQAFHESESLRSFLSFIVNKLVAGEEDQIKEYTIAIDVFGRGAQFNPRIDSVVRVQAGRLRYKLQEYYSTEGKSDKILIELPKGHYKPVFSFIEANNGAVKTEEVPAELPRSAVETAVAVTEEEASGGAKASSSWLVLGLSIAVVVLSLSTGLLYWANQKARTQTGANAQGKAEPVYGAVWGDFLKSPEPTLVVIGNPLVYRLANPMDPQVDNEQSILLRPEQTSVVAEAIGKDQFLMNSIRNNTAPRLLLSRNEYTGVGEAIGLHYVTDLMRSSAKAVTLKQSRTASAEDLKNQNVILLGSIWVNEWTSKQPIKESFIYSDSATILNHEPQAGEDQEYKPKFNANGKLIEDYALITVKPGLSGKNTMMILAGIYSEGTQAAAEFATSKYYLPTLNQRLQEIFGNQQTPKYYQALLKVTVDNGIPTLISLVSVHVVQTGN